MKATAIDAIRCPITHSTLELIEITHQAEDEIITGQLINKDGRIFKIVNGIIDFVIMDEEEKNQYAISLFKEKAKSYDEYQHLSFETFYKDENTVRNELIDKLRLIPASKVLEVNAGTGRDSILIAKRLSKDGLLHVQDISADMLFYCKEKLKNVSVPYLIHQSNASVLPYENQLFDSVYSFGGVGMNTYSDNKKAIKEMVRVTKAGGRIVFGGLSLAPWLRNTLFGKVLVNHNPHYANNISFDDLPIEARELNVSWILNGAGFVVDFTVGEGEPSANFNYEIPGPRGGTLFTRFYGQLEGVTNETKKLAYEASEKLGISMHKWLDEVIKEEAIKIKNQ